MIDPNYKFAKDMAKKVLKKYGINDVPTDLQVICKGIGLEYVELDDPEELDGAIIEINGMRVAMLNKAKSFIRGRFTLAHELGHIFLEHGKRDFYDAEVAREQGEDVLDNAKPAKERESDVFASELLMPTEQLKKYQNELKNLERVADIFKVSKQSMSIAISNFFSSAKNYK